ncbi:MAG TPA: hypothetical protein VKG43_04970 [Acidimicrobiales bacterium]|nr:hypothetical protein [Acidimicrobiales bacterium]
MFASTAPAPDLSPPQEAEEEAREQLAALAARVRPVSNAASRLLPLTGPLRPLFAHGGLRRGSTVLVTGVPGGGATTLALSLLVGTSRAGGWCALVGTAHPGVVAMAELGLDLARVAIVPVPAAAWAEAAGQLLGGVDVVLVRPPGRVRLTAGRHLSARARERQSTLVVLAAGPGDWPEAPDVTLRASGARWEGIGRGHGHLRARRTTVEVTGRRGGDRAAAHALWLPAAGQRASGAGPADPPGAP